MYVCMYDSLYDLSIVETNSELVVNMCCCDSKHFICDARCSTSLGANCFQDNLAFGYPQVFTMTLKGAKKQKQKAKFVFFLFTH